MDKQFLVDQLAARIRESAEVARREQVAAADEAQNGASADEKRADARVALEFSNLARAQGRRAKAAQEELATIESFKLPVISGDAPRATLGTIVEVEDGDEGRTIFLAPVGAGIELIMPGGDGYVTVVTTASPLGRAVMGRRVGETIDVEAKGDCREWTVTYVA